MAGASDPGGLDGDDTACVPGKDAWTIHVTGCFQSDGDFDGPSYQNDWPGTNPDPKVDAKLHPQPLFFTSPTTVNGDNYPTTAFEADLPAIESSCNRITGAGCFNPPPGSSFYPFFSTRVDSATCTWQEGGDFIPGTVNDYGGSSAQFGPLLSTVFPEAGFTTRAFFENFNSGDMPNGCPVG